MLPVAGIFDLSFGVFDVCPGEREGMLAAECATSEEYAQGCVGGGTGVTIWKCFGAECAQRSGLGSATVELSDEGESLCDGCYECFSGYLR